jgi:hypothetical protein
LDRVRFIELIESETARLSPEGRDLWEELELIREFILDPADEERMAWEYDVMERTFDLPMQEQFVTSSARRSGGGSWGRRTGFAV